jgi:hypothetical protein
VKARGRRVREAAAMFDARIFCSTSAGALLLVGLLTGTWKYACTARSPDARAPYYVDTAHRASLMYAFACAVLAQLCAESAWSNATNLAAAVVLVALFVVTIAGYIVHGALRDTDNQFRVPHQLGARTIPTRAMTAFMGVLIAGEVGGVAVLLAGFVRGATRA